MPDARKGERIVLLTTQKDADRGAMQRQAKATGASELAVPATCAGGRQGAAARKRQDRLCRRHRARKRDRRSAGNGNAGRGRRIAGSGGAGSGMMDCAPALP